MAPPSQSCGVSGKTNSAKLVLRRKRKSRNDKDSSGNTGNPANGDYPTFSGLTTDGSKYYGFFTENRANIANGTLCNFGLGFFGTTAVSSAGSNGNGSVFEYDVPSGYYALNTENLGAQS